MMVMLDQISERNHQSASLIVAAPDALYPERADLTCGLTDADIQLQAAIDAGSNSNKSIQLLGSTFNLSNPLTFGDSQAVTIIGEGINVTELYNATGRVFNINKTDDADSPSLFISNLYMRSGADHAFYASHLLHSNFGILRARAATGYYGMYFENSMKNKIDYLRISVSGNGLAIVASEAYNPGNITIGYLYVPASANIGLYLYGLKDVSTGRVNYVHLNYGEISPGSGATPTAIKMYKAQYCSIDWVSIENADVGIEMDGDTGSADYSMFNRIKAGTIYLPGKIALKFSRYTIGNQVIVLQDTNNSLVGDIDEDLRGWASKGAFTKIFPNNWGNVERPNFEERFGLYRDILAAVLDVGNVNVLYPCDDVGASTIVRDASGNGLNMGASENVDSWDTKPAIEGRAKYYSFNGTDEEMSRADDDKFTFGDGSSDSAFTFLCLAKINNTAAERTLMSKWDETTGAEAREWLLTITTDDKLKLELADESANVVASRVTDGAITMDAWKVFIVTYDGGGGNTAADGITIYENGVVVASTATNDPAYVAMENLTVQPRLGCYEGTGGTLASFFDGEATWFGIFAAELTGAQVYALTQHLQVLLGI